MKNRLNRFVAFICAIMMICAVFVPTAAEEMPATPTDLSPVEETVQEQTEMAPAEEVPMDEQGEEPAEAEDIPVEEQGEEPDEPEEAPAEEPTAPEETPAEEQEDEPAEEEEPSDSVEILITKAVRIGECWEGKVSRTRPAVLKLDLEYSRTVYMLVEGKGVCVTAEKTDGIGSSLFNAQTDPDTERAVVTWNAEAGSYLITVSPDENSLMARAKVSFMNEEAYKAWEEQISEEPEEETSEEMTEETPEDPTEETTGASEEVNPETTEAITEETDEQADEPEFTLPENRSVRINITWDTDHPRIGDTAHFGSVITGYENYSYTLQWQISRDEENWTDYSGATEPQLDVVLTEEMDGAFFRLVIYVESEQEA